MQDKLTIEVSKKERNVEGWRVIKVTAQTHDLLMGLKEQTGLPINKIVEMIMDFSIERIEIVEVK